MKIIVFIFFVILFHCMDVFSADFWDEDKQKYITESEYLAKRQEQVNKTIEKAKKELLDLELKTRQKKAIADLYKGLQKLELNKTDLDVMDEEIQAIKDTMTNEMPVIANNNIYDFKETYVNYEIFKIRFEHYYTAVTNARVTGKPMPIINPVLRDENIVYGTVKMVTNDGIILQTVDRHKMFYLNPLQKELILVKNHPMQKSVTDEDLLIIAGIFEGRYQYTVLNGMVQSLPHTIPVFYYAKPNILK